MDKRAPEPSGVSNSLSSQALGTSALVRVLQRNRIGCVAEREGGKEREKKGRKKRRGRGRERRERLSLNDLRNWFVIVGFGKSVWQPGRVEAQGRTHVVVLDLKTVLLVFFLKGFN